jgi:excinuclease ABC subunit A
LPVSALHALLLPCRVANSRHPADQALDAILARLGYLEDVGLGYLTLDRQSRTLSGGEIQRVNLTACLGAALADALFVLDEPSIGLHPRDLARMSGILRRLVAQGNTVVVVEHDESIMRTADHLIEIGPRPGAAGGQLVYSGTPAGIARAKNSATAPWLTGKRHPAPSRARTVDAHTPRWRIAGLNTNNLRNLEIAIPVARFNALCGVSGSGKSSLLEALGTGTLIDQTPLSRTPRSNPALYSGAWDAVRRLLAADPAAESTGLTPSHFSFNSGDGRCPHCSGSGWETVEMQFLADVHVPCPICDGRRFRDEILAFKYQEKTVADILSLTIADALTFFANTPAITRPLTLLEEVGLGYLTFGQPLNTLSGGEAQRLKLVRFLDEAASASSTATSSATTSTSPAVHQVHSVHHVHPFPVARPAPPRSLLLLDEPTTGLHREDITRLVAVLQRLVDAGHTLLVVEHNTDILLAADFLLELGPGAGPEGGHLIAAAPPAQVAQENTPTAPYLRAALAMLT